MLIVQKYGGTSLADNARIQNAAARAAALAAQGNQVVVVVSAQGDTTDRMLVQAQLLSPFPSPRETDALIAAGEQISAALMAMAVTARGAEAVSLTGWQAGIHTDSTHADARIHRVDPRRIRSCLEKGAVVVAAGFQGIDANEDITTLGRGGSDTTAAALAGALQADRCQIYTDVDGIYDRDPRRFPDAKRYRRISYTDMLALCRSGAQVLHDRCVELARENGTVLEVLSSFRDLPGTLVGDFQTV